MVLRLSITDNILGIVNISPDSFSGDGLFKKENKLSKLLDFAERNNINNLDIGCASSKPGYENVSTQEELNRLNYFLSNVNGNFSLSIDTSNPVMATLEDIQYNHSGLFTKPKANMNDYFYMLDDQVDYDLLHYNLNKFKLINNL